MEQAHLCVTCGVQFAASEAPPPRCPICEDERQYVGGGTPERVIRTDPRRSLERSLARHGRALRGEHDVVAW